MYFTWNFSVGLASINSMLKKPLKLSEILLKIMKKNCKKSQKKQYLVFSKMKSNIVF